LQKDTYIAKYMGNLLVAGPSRKEIQKPKEAMSDSFDATDLGSCRYHLDMAITNDRKYENQPELKEAHRAGT